MSEFINANIAASLISSSNLVVGIGTQIGVSSDSIVYLSMLSSYVRHCYTRVLTPNVVDCCMNALLTIKVRFVWWC